MDGDLSPGYDAGRHLMDMLPTIPFGLLSNQGWRSADQAGGYLVIKKFAPILAGAALAISVAMPAEAQSDRTFYWISHGSPADPV